MNQQQRQDLTNLPRLKERNIGSTIIRFWDDFLEREGDDHWYNPDDRWDRDKEEAFQRAHPNMNGPPATGQTPDCVQDWLYFGNIDWRIFKTSMMATRQDLQRFTMDKLQDDTYAGVWASTANPDEVPEVVEVFLDDLNKCVNSPKIWKRGTINIYHHWHIDWQQYRYNTLPQRSCRFEQARYGTCTECYGCGPMGMVCKRCKEMDINATFQLVSFEPTNTLPAVPLAIGRISGYIEAGYDYHVNRYAEHTALYEYIQQNPVEVARGLLDKSPRIAIKLSQGACIHRGDVYKLFRRRANKKHYSDLHNWHPEALAKQLSFVLRMSWQEIDQLWRNYIGEDAYADQCYQTELYDDQHIEESEGTTPVGVIPAEVRDEDQMGINYPWAPDKTFSNFVMNYNNPVEGEGVLRYRDHLEG